MTDYTKFNEPFPLYECFTNKISKDISLKEYNEALTLFNKLDFKIFKDWHDLYLKCDVYMLADILLNFKNKTYDYYGIDLCHYVSAPAHS